MDPPIDFIFTISHTDVGMPFLTASSNIQLQCRWCSKCLSLNGISQSLQPILHRAGRVHKFRFDALQVHFEKAIHPRGLEQIYLVRLT